MVQSWSGATNPTTGERGLDFLMSSLTYLVRSGYGHRIVVTWGNNPFTLYNYNNHVFLPASALFYLQACKVALFSHYNRAATLIPISRTQTASMPATKALCSSLGMHFVCFCSARLCSCSSLYSAFSMTWNGMRAWRFCTSCFLIVFSKQA